MKTKGGALWVSQKRGQRGEGSKENLKRRNGTQANSDTNGSERKLGSTNVHCIPHISLPSYVDYLRIFVSHNIFHIHLNTMICTSMHTYIYIFTDPSSAQVGLNAELVMKRAELQYAIKSNK